MSIKSQGGVFGRNPTFNDVTVEGDLSIDGTLTIGGETITGLSYQGGWNASTNTPDIAASSPVTGQFWIVSADGSTNVGGITNWTQGDWALYDGSAWQRVEGGNTDLTTGVQGQLAVANGGTGAADATNARSNLGLVIGTDVEAADATILKSAAIGVTVQGYDADTAKYDDTTANFTGTLQNGGSNVVVDSDIGSTVQAYDANILTSSDIGSTVQAYDADTTKNDVANSFTDAQTITKASAVGLTVNRTTSQGDAIEIQYDGSKVGTIGRKGGSLYISDIDGTGFRFESNGIVMTDGDGDKIAAGYSLGLGAYPIGSIFMGAGHGIYLNGQTSDALDDYEEGTWTPNQGAGLTVVGTFSSSGSYTKVGRVVTVSGILFGATSIATTTGGVISSNLPFTQATGNSVGRCINNAWTSSTDVIVSGANVYSATATTASAYIFFSATYFV